MHTPNCFFNSLLVFLISTNTTPSPTALLRSWAEQDMFSNWTPGRTETSTASSLEGVLGRYIYLHTFNFRPLTHSASCLEVCNLGFLGEIFWSAHLSLRSAVSLFVFYRPFPSAVISCVFWFEGDAFRMLIPFENFSWRNKALVGGNELRLIAESIFITSQWASNKYHLKTRIKEEGIIKEWVAMGKIRVMGSVGGIWGHRAML